MNKVYSDEMVRFILDNVEKYTATEFMPIFNEKFKTNKRYTNITEFLRKNGYKHRFKKNVQRKYTDEMIQWLRENWQVQNKDLAKMFNEKFYPVATTTRKLKDIRGDYGIPLCPTIKREANSGSFKKGSIPANKKMVGDVIFDNYTKDLVIKLYEEDRPSVYNYKKLARVVYEMWNNELLESTDCIIFRDGNKFNLAKENLMKLSKADIGFIQCKMRGLGLTKEESPEIREIFANIALLNQALEGLKDV